MYFEDFQSLVGPLAFGVVTYNSNNLFNVGGALGGNPRQYGELIQIYSRWIVYCTKILCEVTNTAAVGTIQMVISPHSTSVPPASLTVAATYPRSRISSYSSVASRLSARLSHFQSTVTPMGLIKKQMNDDVFAGSTIGGPAQNWFYHVSIGATDGITPVTWTLRTRLTYYVQWFDRFAPLP